ncbi:MAG: phosphodiester glycosidase family protein [Microcoleaceae cyanobacterium]
MINPQANFSDLTHHWARPFILRLSRQGIIRGFPDGTFRPEQPMTRAEFATVLKAAFAVAPQRTYVPFVDVPINFWGAAAIRYAHEAGFISGFPGNYFYPQRNIIRLHVLLALVSGLRLQPATPVLALENIYTDFNQIPGYAIAAIQTATQKHIIVNFPNPALLNPNRPATRAEVCTCVHQALVEQARLLPIASAYIVEPATSGTIRNGTHLAVNGRRWKIAWGQQSSGITMATGISDKGIMLVLGINPLDTTEPSRQLIHWFLTTNSPAAMPTYFDPEYRYLDINQFGIDHDWEVEIDGKTLNIFSVIQQVKGITWTAAKNQAQIKIDLNQPTPWELYELNSEWEVVIDAITSQVIADQFSKQTELPTPPNHSEAENEGETIGSLEQPKPPIVKPGIAQTVIQGRLPEGYRVRVSTSTAPNQIRIELRQDALVNRNILWTSGLNWRQQYLTLGLDQFPVVWLKLQPKSGLILRPIWTDPTQMKGITALVQMAETWKSLAAINGGYFNRNNLLPLGAIRREGTWFSGPILNRGAIAWNDTGTVKMARLTLVERVTNSTGTRFDTDLLNTGYVKAGIARYTSAWGSTYTPLTLNEVALVVENNLVTRQVEAPDDKTPIAIPAKGYLLILRSFRSALGAFPVGTQVILETQTTPADFGSFPNILGGGPLLLQGGKVVVDAEAEGFNYWFGQQAAIRSGVGVTALGEMLIVTVHNRVGGTGPKLTEMAQLMQQLGAIDALNLDGGSSTSLVLGGQLLNRTADTAAPVQNGLAVFRV